MKVLRYNQTKLNILHQIAGLNLQAGNLLPSERTMADKFGVSMGTLRRALSELEAQSVIEKQHGRGNVLLKSLDNCKARNRIALIHIKRLAKGEFFPNLNELEAYLNERSIDMEYIPVTSFDKSLITKVEKCFAVLVNGWLDDEWVQNLQLLNKPMVAIGSHGYSQQLPLVSYDWKGASAMLTAKLIENGAKRIGLLNGSHRYYPSTLIYEGYKNELAKSGLELNEEWISWIAKEETDEKIKDFIIHQLQQLDAVVFEFGTYYPFLSLCWSMGISPDKKLAVIGGYNTKGNVPVFGNKVLCSSFEKDAYIVGTKIFLETLQRDNASIKGETIISAKLS